MQDHPGQLPIPDQVASDPKAIELVRIWAGNGKQQVAMATGLWEDPAKLGHNVGRSHEAHRDRL